MPYYHSPQCHVMPGSEDENGVAGDQGGTSQEAGNTNSIPPEETIETEPVQAPETSGERKVVINELLCYASFYLNSCTADNIAKIVIGHFSEDDILTAKKVLWEEPNRPHLKKFQTRRDTVARTCAAANISDILDALSDLDKKRDIAAVCYVASNLGCMPPSSPEDINEIALLHRVMALEKKIDGLQAGVDLNVKKLFNHDTLIENLSDGLAHQHAKEVSKDDNKERHSSVAENDNADESSCDNSSDEETESQISDHSDVPLDTGREKSDGAQISPAHRGEGVNNGNTRDMSESSGPRYKKVNTKSLTKNRTLSEVVTKGVVRRHSHPMLSASRMDEHHNQDAQRRSNRFPQPGGQLSAASQAKRTEADWKNGRSTQSKQRSRHHSGPNRRNADSEDDGFIVPRSHRRASLRYQKNQDFKVFLSNIDRKHHVENVYDSLRRLGVSVRGLYQRSHPNANQKSFVCIVSERDSGKVLKQSNWPKGIKVRSYK